MGIYNYTLGGRTMAYPNDHTFNNAFAKPDMYQSIPEDVNYITIMLGINDVSHLMGYSPDGESTAGAISLGTIDSVDTGTFYGAWNVVLQWLFENRPFAHIGIIVTNGLGMQGPSGEYSQYGMQVYTALKEIVKKWNVPYIDLNGGDGKTPMMQRGIYPEGTPASLIAAKWNAFAISPNTPIDGHPNYQAQEYMSCFIENFLRTL
jgi:lysophospholipase L1-like esterase